MAATLGAFAAVRVAVELLLRPRYLPSQTISYSFLQQSPRFGLGDWVLSSRVFDPTGRFVSPDGSITVSPSDLARVCPGITRGVTFPDKGQVGRCLGQLGVRFVDTYQPGNRYWLFQGIESAIFLGAAAGLIVLAVWLIRRRIS